MLAGMTGDQWKAVRSRFEAIQDLSLSDRPRYLVETRDSDPEMYGHLCALLNAADGLDEFLADPPWSAPVTEGETAIPPGTVLAERFEVESFLGAGGAGEVYRAWDRQRQIWVAVKTLKPGMASDSAALAALRREVNLASVISHRNVCRLYDLSIPNVGERAAPFLTMELLEGETLAQRARRQPFAIEEALPVAEQLAAGLAAAHERGIVHGDFKSANVMLAENGGRAVIMDFGLARQMEPGENSIGTISAGLTGTPAYMAPEQIEGRRATPAADIHALGVILFEMVTGKLPFHGDSPMAVASARLHGEAPSPREFAPDLDRRWEYGIRKCMARDPRERPGSVYEVLAHFSAPVPLQISRRGLAGTGLSLAALGACAFLVWRRVHSEIKGPSNPKADVPYQRGLIFAQRRTEEGTKNAIAEFREAIRLDPQWAAPCAELADALATGTNFAFLHSEQAMREARSAAERAIELDPNLTRGHAGLAWILSLDYVAWPKADGLFQRAIELDPNDPQTRTRYAANLRKRGLYDQADRQIQAAMKLKSDDPGIRRERTLLYFTARRFKEFHAEAEDQARLYPNDSINMIYLARSRAMRGQIADARQILDQCLRVGGNANTAMIERALAEASCGNFKEAERYASEVRNGAGAKPSDGLMLAGVYAQTKDFDSAFDVLERSYRAKDTTLLSLGTSPLVDPLRSDSRFRSLLRRLNFPDQSTQ